MRRTNRPAAMRAAGCCAAVLFLLAAPARGQATRTQSPRAEEARGDSLPDFPRVLTIHHFRLYPDGGAIEFSTRNPADTVCRAAIRAHLERIAELFAAGDLRLPARYYGRVPPGTPEMRKLADKINYRFEPTDDGGRVWIATRNARALVAIHEFLRFEIERRRTGDPETVFAPVR